MFNDHITDRKTYNMQMSLSLLDKAFFLDKVQADVFVDIGCADGAMLKMIKHILPNVDVIGYDISETAINNIVGVDGFLFSDWEKLEDFVRDNFKGKRVAAICNSVIHEVYAYGDERCVDLFWRRLFENSIFDVVIIRDMAISEKSIKSADPISVVNVNHKGNKQQIADFEREWGSITANNNLIHFLLKYRYISNWEREVRENYLPITYEQMVNMIPRTYSFKHIEHFTLPFTRETVWKDFGVQLQDNTHIKMIVERG